MKDLLENVLGGDEEHYLHTADALPKLDLCLSDYKHAGSVLATFSLNSDLFGTERLQDQGEMQWM